MGKKKRKLEKRGGDRKIQKNGVIQEKMGTKLKWRKTGKNRVTLGSP